MVLDADLLALKEPKDEKEKEEDTMSDATTMVPPSEAESCFDCSVDGPYVASLTFLKKKTCPGCLHSSWEMNPITKGPFARNKKFPCWPWYIGGYAKPKSLHCRFCVHVFKLASFDAEYASLESL